MHRLAARHNVALVYGYPERAVRDGVTVVYNSAQVRAAQRGNDHLTMMTVYIITIIIIACLLTLFYNYYAHIIACLLTRSCLAQLSKTTLVWRARTCALYGGTQRGTHGCNVERGNRMWEQTTVIQKSCAL